MEQAIAQYLSVLSWFRWILGQMEAELVSVYIQGSIKGSRVLMIFLKFLWYISASFNSSKHTLHERNERKYLEAHISESAESHEKGGLKETRNLEEPLKHINP